MSYLLVVVLPGEVEETGWGEELIVGEGKPLHCGSACRQEESLEEFLRCRSLEMWSASTSASLSSSLAVLCCAVLRCPFLCSPLSSAPLLRSIPNRAAVHGLMSSPSCGCALPKTRRCWRWAAAEGGGSQSAVHGRVEKSGGLQRYGELNFNLILFVVYFHSRGNKRTSTAGFSIVTCCCLPPERLLIKLTCCCRQWPSLSTCKHVVHLKFRFI